MSNSTDAKFEQSYLENTRASNPIFLVCDAKHCGSPGPVPAPKDDEANVLSKIHDEVG